MGIGIKYEEGQLLLRRIKVYWQAVIAILISICLIATPAMAGVSAAKIAANSVTASGDCEPCELIKGEVVWSTDSLNYKELNGSELDELVQKAISDDGVQQLVEHLSDKEANLKEKRAAKWQFDGQEGSIVLLNYKGKEDVQIVYSAFGDNVKVGAGVFKTTDKKTQIKAYDLVDGKIYHASTIISVKDSNGKPGKPSVEYHSSPLVKDSKTIGSLTENGIAASSCNICMSVCQYIIAGGCGVSGYFICVAACAPFGNVTCPVICGVVWALICTYGANKNCPELCASYC